MAKQIFKTPLNFQEVEVGTREDKVLVRTADGDVKEVPSDSFGGGGSQNLQQTIENGGLYLVDDSDKTRAVAFFEPTLDEGTVIINSANKTPDFKGQYFSLSPSNTIISGSSGDKQGQFGMYEHKPRMIQTDTSLGSVLDLSLEDPTVTGTAKILVPAKTPRFEEDGVTPIPYRLATLDDITGGGSASRFGIEDTTTPSNRVVDLGGYKLDLTNSTEYHFGGTSVTSEPVEKPSTVIIDGSGLGEPTKWVLFYPEIGTTSYYADVVMVLDDTSQTVRFNKTTIGGAMTFYIADKISYTTMGDNVEVTLVGEVTKMIAYLPTSTLPVGSSEVLVSEGSQLKTKRFGLNEVMYNGQTTSLSMLFKNDSEEQTSIGLGGITVDSGLSSSYLYAGNISARYEDAGNDMILRTSIQPNSLRIDRTGISTGEEIDYLALSGGGAIGYIPNNGLNTQTSIYLGSRTEAGNATFNLPNKPEGVYTLATLDDITGGGDGSLQDFVDNNQASAIKGGNSVSLLSGDAPNTFSRIYGGTTDFAHSNFISVYQNEMAIHSNNETIGKSSAINFDDGEMYLQLVANTGVTRVRFEEPIALTGTPATLKFPAKLSGEYTLATLDDITGGGSQHLQSVLTEGYQTDSPMEFIDPTNSSYKMRLSYYEGLSTSFNGFSAGISWQGMGVIQDGTGAGISITPDSKITFSRQISVDEFRTNVLDFTRATAGEVNYSFPEKPTGDYVLSTTNDITIQNALSVNNRTDQGIKVQQEAPDTDAYVSYVSYTSEGINGRTETGHAYYYSSDGMRISAEGGGELTYTSGNRSLEWNADTENPRKTRLSLDRTTDGESVFSFPERDGNFTLVTASDIAVSNNTTTVLSASDLNTAYPIAIVGTQVHCLSITTGAVIYTKTAVGWVQHSITAVS